MYNRDDYYNDNGDSMNVKDIRRQNTRALAAIIGGITALGQRLGKTQAQISHLIGRRPLKNIGDRMAAQIERSFNKPHGWLDQMHPEFMQEYEKADTEKSFKEEKLHWLPLLKSEQIQLFLNDPKAVPVYSYEIFPTQLNVSAKSFAMRGNGSGISNLADFKIQAESIFIVDSTSPLNEGALVIASKSSLNDIALYRFYPPARQPQSEVYQAQPTINDPQQILGVVRQVVLNLE